MRRAAFWAVASLSVFVVTAFVSFATADSFGSGDNQFTIDFVLISGETNPTEAQTTAGGLDGFGIVEYDYRMGVYEITNDQWNKFKAELGVPVTGSPSIAYDSGFYNWGTGTIDVPTNQVSWYEAAQFVNWLNTSIGQHAAYKFTGTQGTRDYTFTTWDASEAWGGTNIYRHQDAYYFLPDEDEWFKAAYWNGTDIQDYPTKPGDILHQGDGTSGTGWNYWDGEFAIHPQGPWNVGSGSREFNGTFDMVGNNWEWLESPHSDLSYGAASPRGLRGGGLYNASRVLLASTRNYDAYPMSESRYAGFRVASIPEPGCFGFLLGIVSTTLLRRGRKTHLISVHSGDNAT